MGLDLELLLKAMVSKKASDLHVKANSRPVLRVGGSLKKLNVPPPSAGDIDSVVFEMIDKRLKSVIDKTGAVDFSRSFTGIGRFRINCYKQMGTLALAIRSIPDKVPTFEDLRLPGVLKEISSKGRGLVLVTGAAGSGKSTTLAAMVDYINSQYYKSIITIEDPIEFIYTEKKSLISQREIGTDADSFISALRDSLREDPDIIMLGEIRDLETMRTVLMAAETGHLVLSSLHSSDAIHTIGRVLSFFPTHEADYARELLVDTLEAIISLRLLPMVDGSGRVPAVEVLVASAAVRECLADPEKFSDIKSLMESGGDQYGMQTFDQSIFKLYRDGKITYSTAIEASTNPGDLDLKIRGIESISSGGWS